MKATKAEEHKNFHSCQLTTHQSFSGLCLTTRKENLCKEDFSVYFQ